ncbi:hypothetical protein [Microbacterium sp. YY-01]|uniref:hypothetical protein n=1 Tax=Microbacterium sp. YY-01 TaxID=3421634 RepID=UPI003D184666
MEPAQLITLILSSGLVSGVAVKLLDWVRDARAGQLQKRRAEVDRALKERDRAKDRAESAEAAEDMQARRVRIVEESLAVHRRVIIDAPCLGPDYLPIYPYRKE